jgi:hypothetical protein
MSKRLFKEFIERAENGGLVPIKPPNWWEEQPTDLSRRVYKTVDLLKIALEIGADSDPIRRLKQKYAPQDAIGSGVTDTHDEIAVLAAPAVSGKKTARKRRDEKRPEIERALEALESSPDWAKSSDKSRCRSVEQHLGKPEGWCSPRTLRRAIEGREKASRG